MKKTIKKPIAIAGITLLCASGIGVAVGNYYATKYSPIISTYFGHPTYKKVEGTSTEDTNYFERQYTSEKERLAADAKAGKEAAAEGIVLLKNDQNLPLKKES